MAGGMEEKMNIKFIVLSMKVKAFQKYQAYENKYMEKIKNQVLNH